MHDNGTCLLRLEGVTKRFEMGDRDLAALDGISLGIRRGEFVAVMGPSGSGKSTLLNIVGCLDRPNDGISALDGEDVGRASVRRRARVRNTRFGFVFQDFNLLRRSTALENVELPLLYRGVSAAQRHKRARAALSALGLAERADHFPKQLSGGEQQRVAIARALVGQPDILLADEPTGSLDTGTGQGVMSILGKLNALGITIVLVTHDSAVSAHAGRLVTMRDGKIVSDSGAARAPALLTASSGGDGKYPGGVAA